ncbi:hypothetical protein Golax_003273, partial [Gossypium laxum]|nr:hypothetical protein [Gossypium laxum]
MVVVLDGNVLDLGKHSMVIFKETPNPNKGEVLRDRGDDEVGKELPTPKGCASSKSPRIFYEYNREHKPNIVSLLETR